TIIAPGRVRDERKERQWRRWINDWRGGGLRVRGFFSPHGLGTPSFFNLRPAPWRRGAGGPALVPVRVAADAGPAPGGGPGGALEVVLVDGRAVRVAPGFDTATRRQLLAVLEGRPC